MRRQHKGRRGEKLVCVKTAHTGLCVQVKSFSASGISQNVASPWASREAYAEVKRELLTPRLAGGVPTSLAGGRARAVGPLIPTSPRPPWARPPAARRPGWGRGSEPPNELVSTCSGTGICELGTVKTQPAPERGGSTFPSGGADPSRSSSTSTWILRSLRDPGKEPWPSHSSEHVACVCTYIRVTCTCMCLLSRLAVLGSSAVCFATGRVFSRDLPICPSHGFDD